MPGSLSTTVRIQPVGILRRDEVRTDHLRSREHPILSAAPRALPSSPCWFDRHSRCVAGLRASRCSPNELGLANRVQCWYLLSRPLTRAVPPDVSIRRGGILSTRDQDCCRAPGLGALRWGQPVFFAGASDALVGTISRGSSRFGSPNSTTASSSFCAASAPSTCSAVSMSLPTA